MALLIIEAVEVYRFSIPFIQPIRVGNVLLSRREGFILILTDRKGRVGLGEVAPLPGWDLISLEQCKRDLAVVNKWGGGSNVTFEQFIIQSPFTGTVPLTGVFTSHARFGIECALLHLYLQERLNHLPDPIRIPVSGLFIPDPMKREFSRQIRALKASGVRTVKVKVGRLQANEEIRQILNLVDEMGKDLILRLDGNKNLSAETYLAYCRELHHLNVEYAEEPLRDGETPPSEAFSWPKASDESLSVYIDSRHPDPSSLPPDIRTVILKPGLLAGMSGMFRFTAAAAKRNIQTILSSAFNTGVTLAGLGAFARLAGLPPATAHGLDTLRYLESDVLMESPSVTEGMLQIPRELLSGMRLNFHVLTKENL